jgi:transposase-like protein
MTMCATYIFDDGNRHFGRKMSIGRATRTTPEQRADILAKHKAGTTISELSRLYGVSRATVMRIAKPGGALAWVASLS